jgi:NADH dehydrogenase
MLDHYAFFPITRDQLTMLMEGNTCDGYEPFRTFGLMTTPFDTANLSYLRIDGRK